jgi:hypothetical protein
MRNWEPAPVNRDLADWPAWLAVTDETFESVAALRVQSEEPKEGA